MSDPIPDVGRMAGLRDLIVDGIAAARDKVRPDDHHHGDKRLARWLDSFEDELSPHIAAHIGHIVDHPDTPPATRELFTKLSAPEHATAIALLVTAAAAVVYPFVQAGIAPEVQAVADIAWSHNPTLNLSPAEAALAAVRHTGGGLNLAGEAATSGINAERFDVMVKNTGEAPAIGELLLAYRRGQIDHGRLITGIRQSRLRDEWADVIIGLRYGPPSASEAIAAAVQGHLTPADARDKVQDAGLDPVNFDWMLETAGRPPGAEQLLHLLNRELVSEDFVRGAIRESDIKNKYIDAIIESRRYIPPVRSLVAMRRNHALDDAQFRRLMRDNGVIDADIDIYLKEASRARTSAQHDLTVAQIRDAYETRLVDRAGAHGRLVTLGYDDAESNMILDLADRKRADALIRASAARVHNLYVAHKIDRSDASADLDAMGVPHEARDEWLRLWTLERQANVAHLTLAQTQGALRRGAISLTEFRTRVRAMGYQADDVEILAAEAFPPPKAPKALSQRDLSVAQITKGYKTQLIDRTTAAAQIGALGYDANETEFILHLAENTGGTTP